MGYWQAWGWGMHLGPVEVTVQGPVWVGTEAVQGLRWLARGWGLLCQGCSTCKPVSGPAEAHALPEWQVQPHQHPAVTAKHGTACARGRQG